MRLKDQSIVIHFGRNHNLDSFRDAPNSYGIHEFESPTRSTIPLLSLLSHAPTVFSEVLADLAFPSEYEAFLEYTVSPRKGRGKASHTDLMLKSGSSALAIEAKWTEPMYESVGAWIRRGTNQGNRMDVLDGWLSILQPHAVRTLACTDFSDVVYQMLHRTASVAAFGGDCSVAYLVFRTPDERNRSNFSDIITQLGILRDKLGKPSSIQFFAVLVDITPLDSYKTLLALPKGLESTADDVIAALQDTKPLFSFTISSCCKIESSKVAA